MSVPAVKRVPRFSKDLASLFEREIVWITKRSESRPGCGFALHLVAGGQLPRLLNPLWRWWGRRREFAADTYASRLGHGESLAAALEEQLPFDAASPWMKGRSHPYAEIRIDRLRAFSGPGIAPQRDARHSQKV